MYWVASGAMDDMGDFAGGIWGFLGMSLLKKLAFDRIWMRISYGIYNGLIYLTIEMGYNGKVMVM